MAGSENEPANSSSASSSAEEEEEVSSESESTPPPSSKKTQPSSDDSGSESDESPEKPQLPDPNIIKPLSSKPMDHDEPSKNPRSKHPVLKQHSTGKRPAEEADAGDVKRANKKTATVVAVAAPDADNCEKKQLFQRLWSEDNEIELIQGMIDYAEEKGKDPLADVNGFYEFVKGSLHVDVNDKQVLTKARRLKKKFQDNAARVIENKGKVRSFSIPHEKKMYDLSKSLWGDDNTTGNKRSAVMSACSKKVKAKVNVTPKTNKIISHNKSVVGLGNGNVGSDDAEPKLVQAVRSGFGLMGVPITDEVIMNKGLELVSGPKKVEMEEKWKNLKVLELEHFLNKLDVLKEQAEVVLNAIAKSGAK